MIGAYLRRLLPAVSATFVLLGPSPAAAAGLRSCPGFTEEHGIYTVMIGVRRVSCRAGRGEYAALIRAVRAGRLNDPRIEPRPHHAYGHFGRRFKLNGFTCRLAAEGLAGAEFTLRCFASRGRAIDATRV